MESRKIKILVCGSRSFDNETFVENYLFKFFEYLKNKIENIDIIIISGMAKGPDLFAVNFAKKYNYEVEKYPADWEKHGKSAGYIRNKEMVEISDIVISFWDGISKGTLNSIELAKKKGIPTFVAGSNKVKKTYNLERLEEIIENARIIGDCDLKQE